MTTVFSLLYTLFGAHPFYFHLCQLMLCIGSAIILYLFFRYSFKPVLALVLSLVFLVHPLNSQVAFAIPDMQDALFFFFGILAIWLLVRFSSVKSLLFVALCLLLSLFSKETGIVFVAMSLLYLFWWNRERLYPFIGIVVLPVGIWLALKIHAVGFFGANPHNAPIDNLNFAGRLMTDPSIILFYLTKLIFPYKLASSYYWVHPTFSVRYVLIPLAIDLAVVGLIVYVASVISKRASKAMFYTYLFFTTWCALGLLTTLQIIPLDFTVFEPWFYFPLAGILGMIGVVITVFQASIRPKWFLFVAVFLICIFGTRTALRGLDWRSVYTLAIHDIAASGQNYNADNAVATYFISKGKYSEAKPYALRSTELFQTNTNLVDLGLIDSNLGDYNGSVTAYYSSLKYGNYRFIYENMAALTLVYGNPTTDRQYLLQTLSKFPRDSSLWMALAIFDAEHGGSSEAKTAIEQAAHYGKVPQTLYYAIMDSRSYTFSLLNIDQSISIP
jgi:hypothetical protein